VELGHDAIILAYEIVFEYSMGCRADLVNCYLASIIPYPIAENFDQPVSKMVAWPQSIDTPLF
jgi:hypothetical protein